MIIEETTTYAYKLKYIENVSFNRIRAFAQSFVNELPQELVDDIYEQLNRGLDLLQNEPQMLVYLYSFGNMHQAKLNRAFEQLPDAFLQQPEIRIVDYGCGQAIGTMCYADFLADHGLSQTVKSVTLIEPSEICLKRAALHVSQFFPDAEIHTVCKTFEDLTDDDLAYTEDIPTLHILSNVLDIQEFDLEHFANLIANNLSNHNQFVCVGPYFNYSDKDERMTRFAELLNGNITYSKIFEKGELCDGKTWTAQIVCFSVGELEELSTEVTKEDIENGVEDEYGVFYSKNGKQLLKCKNGELKCYEIKKGTESICEHAFMDCESLQQITIPNTVTDIGDYAFRGCISLKQIHISNSVKFIGDFAFAYCESLNQFTIPNAVIEIGKSAFIGCYSLKQILIFNSVKFIGDFAFSRCESLQQFTIPDSVINIGINPFESCDKIILGSQSQRFIVKNGLLIDNHTNSIVSYIGNDEYLIIPNTINTICEFAFAFCKTLQKVKIPNSMTNIGNCAFAGCKSLQQITIPLSVTKIGDDFSLCTPLRQIIIPNGSTVKFQKMLPKKLWDKLTEN